MPVTPPSLGDSTKLSTITDLIDQVDTFEAASFVSGLINGDFIFESSTPGVPSGWTWTPYTGGTIDIIQTDAYSGAQCVEITSLGTANYGGYLETTDFIEVRTGETRYLDFALKCSAAGIHNKVTIYWFQKDLTASGVLASILAYDESIANPTSWAVKEFAAVVPSDATYAKIRLTGGMNDDTVAGTVRFATVRFHDSAARRLLNMSSNTAASVGRDDVSLVLKASVSPTVSIAGASAVKVWNESNDGAGSNLDADLLDGLQLGNSTNQVAKSNFVMCTDLVAEYVGSLKRSISSAKGSGTANIGIGGSATYTLSGTSGQFYIISVHSPDAITWLSAPPSVASGGREAVIYAWVIYGTSGTNTLAVFNNSGVAADVTSSALYIS